MLKQKTVLVVGAGASAEFEFPIGSGLISTIKTICSFRTDWSGVRLGNERFANALRTFAELNKIEEAIAFAAADSVALRLGGSHKSIDQLIHTYNDNPNFVEVAKLAIAFAISERENSAFGSDPISAWALTAWRKDNWIDSFTANYFSGYQKNSLEDLFSDLAIICFNYDRCMEYGFARALAFHFNLSDLQAIELMRQLIIIHPYGDLGRLPNSRDRIDKAIRLQSSEAIVDMARHIKTFTEEQSDVALGQQTKKVLDDASIIVSLGFGYQAPNIKLLEATKSRSRLFAGTTYGMSKSDAEVGPRNLMQVLNAVTNNTHSIAPVKANEIIQSLQLLLFR